MKKTLFLLMIFFINTNAFATPTQNRQTVELINCLSSTTSWIKVENQKKRIRLLAYDPQEGELSNEIDTFTCELLKNAQKLEIEYEQANEKDQYNRDLVWLYADGKLVQNILIERGYGQINFVKGQYKYINELCENEKKAIQKELGIWKYVGIEEAYCKSGITLKKNDPNQMEPKEQKKKYNSKQLANLLVINAGILLLLIILSQRNKRKTL